jgi:acetoin utilization deacetylase AcuC-like enzyme
MNNLTPVVWSPTTRLHEPRHEVWVGVSTPGTETPERVDAIVAELARHPLVEAVSQDDALLHKVHDADFLRHLQGLSERWRQGPYERLVGQDRAVPYVFPTPALTQSMTPRWPAAVHAQAGVHCYDTMTLVGPGSWEAARAAVDCALGAVELLSAGAATAYALCRPPGHHATRSGYGGSCYLNNAAVAAEAFLAVGHERVGILDVDAHHGNGTQAIFWERPEVAYASLHVDPGAGWFPHFFGYADERGAGAGEGANRNLPLPEGCPDDPWVEGVAQLLDWLTETGCTALVVSLGVDAAAADPESPLQVTEAGFARAGALVREVGLPTVHVQEGGYHLPTLGRLVKAFLDGLVN